MTKEEAVNLILTDKDIDKNKISDGYHTFGELYEHRIELFIMMCIMYKRTSYKYQIWKSQLHSDGSKYDGWFILGIGDHPGKQISYHLPMSKWGECYFADTLSKAPEFDGHTSADVLKRLKSL